MKFELKNVKHSQFASQETNCFEASVWVDGKKSGFAQNDGRGGCTSVNWDSREIRKEVGAYICTLPPVITDLPAINAGEEFFTYAQDIEHIVDDLLTDFLYTRDLKKLLSKRVVFFDRKDDKGYAVKGGTISQTKCLSKDRLRELLAKGESLLKSQYESDAVLNLLPFDKALEMFRGASA